MRRPSLLFLWIGGQLMIVQTQNNIDALAVTTSDTLDLTKGTTRAVMVGASGTVKMTFASGAAVTLTLTAGVYYPFAVTRIWATGTTATGIIALY